MPTLRFRSSRKHRRNTPDCRDWLEGERMQLKHHLAAQSRLEQLLRARETEAAQALGTEQTPATFWARRSVQYKHADESWSRDPTRRSRSPPRPGLCPHGCALDRP